MRRARVALAAAAAGLLIWPGMVALRAMPVVDAEVPVTSPPGEPSRARPWQSTASLATPSVDLVDDLRPGGVRTAAGRGRSAAPQSATVRAAIGPVQRPPATAPAGRHVEPRGVQAVLADAYVQAARSVPGSCHLRPEYLAAIGQIESGSLGGRQLVGHRVVPAILGPLLDGGPFAVVRDTDGGRYDGSAQYDRAVGPMQFLPGTWAWAGRDGDADGRRDPQNVVDASFAAAAYLCRGGRNLSREAALRDAFWSYNQSADYVSAALAWVSYFERNGLGALDAVRRPGGLGWSGQRAGSGADGRDRDRASDDAGRRCQDGHGHGGAPPGSVPTPVTTTPPTKPPAAVADEPTSTTSTTSTTDARRYHLRRPPPAPSTASPTTAPTTATTSPQPSPAPTATRGLPRPRPPLSRLRSGRATPSPPTLGLCSAGQERVFRHDARGRPVTPSPGGGHRVRIRGALRHPGAQARRRGRHADRQDDPPPLPATAVPGRDRHPVRGRDRARHP